MTPDPYQALEAAAFTLTIQPGRSPTTGPTADMFGVPVDLLARRNPQPDTTDTTDTTDTPPLELTP